MRTLTAAVATIAAIAVLGLAAGRGAPAAPAAIVVTAPDGFRLAVASPGARNVRVLYVCGGSIVRLREVFVPQGEAVAGLAWSDDGRTIIVTTRGPTIAIDTRTWRVESGAAQAGAPAVAPPDA
jgi:hypothetical protein